MTYTDYKEDIMSVPDQITATEATMWIMVSHYKFFIISIQHLLNRYLLKLQLSLYLPHHCDHPLSVPLYVNSQIEACLEYSAAGGKIGQLRPPLSWHIHIQTRQAEFHIYTEYPWHKVYPLTSSWSQCIQCFITVQIVLVSKLISLTG